MDIAIINDTHFGVKNGAEVMTEYQTSFFEEVFFPYCIKNKIKKIIHAGDFFDHRKYINFKVLEHAIECFVSKLRENGMTMDIIPGNHDTYFKNSNDLNSLSLLLSRYSDIITIHQDPVDKKFGKTSIGFLPWICEGNSEKCMDFIRDSKSQILVSHLELVGFEMMKGVPANAHGGGLNKSVFSRYEMVLSGHYHTKSSQDNIFYLGTQYELTWADSCDPKFFHVLDTTTRELTPVRNELTLFNKIFYSTSNVPEVDKEKIAGTYVKIVAVEKKDLFEFDKFVDMVQACEPYDLKIIESYDDFVGESIDDSEVDTIDTTTLLNTYVDAIETDLDKERLKKLLQELYVEAQNIAQI